MSSATATRGRASGAANPAVRAGVNPWVIAFTVTLATFMEVLDTSIANVSLPYIAGDLGVSVDEASWVLTTYLVANAIVLPLSGWISSFIGRKRFYMLCVALFTVSSFLCGTATSLTQLIFYRVLQGAGGGGLQPSEQGILLDTFPGEKRGMAMSVYGMAVLVAPILGPTLGGYITENYNWRWIFWINIPVGLVSLFLTNMVVEDPAWMTREREKVKSGPVRVDYIGLGLLALGLAALEIIYDRGQEDDWLNSRFIIILMWIAGLGLTAAVMWELSHPNPIVNFRLLADRNFGVGCLVIFCTFAVLYGSNVLLPQMLQALYGYNAYTAGLILSPSGIVTMIAMPVVGWLLGRKTDARWLIFFGLLFLGAATYYESLITLQVSPSSLVFRRCIQLVNMALIFAPINTAAYQSIPQDQANNATGLFNLVRNEGASFGIAVVSTMLARRGQFHQSRLGERLHDLNPVYTDRVEQLTSYFQAAGYDPVTAHQMALTEVYQLLQNQAVSLSYFDLFWLFAVAALCVAPLVFLMRKSVAGKGPAVGH